MAALVPVSATDRMECVRLLRQHAATLRAMTYQTLVTAVESPEPPDVPASIELAQNYPNPFNPSTTIRYTLPRRSQVTLTMYSTLGQKVATLVNGEVEAGYHEVAFNAADLASGVYFYRMQVRSSDPAGGGTGDHVQTKKLCVIK